jgi:hypothetical protein
MARKLAASHGLGDDDLIIGRAALEELQSRLYCLQAAIEDVDRDLADADAGPGGGPPAGEVRDAFAWLMENARPLARLWIEPRMAEP